MKYTPAVPVLIKNIGVGDRSLGPTNGDGGDDYQRNVVVHALSICGEHSLPEILTAYLAEPNPFLREILLEATSIKEAVTYMVGLHAQHDPRVTDEVLDAFRKDCRLLGCE